MPPDNFQQEDLGKGAAGNTHQATTPAISLPKGGGAIRGIGEKFGSNPVSGTGSFTIPLPLSPGRSGFTPALALSYDSGAGNGPYGLGWTVGYPAISRRTDRGIPQYLDHEESDAYILSGAEDLVPLLQSDGSRFEEQRDGYRIRRYRPRIEGLFARIERWSNLNNPSDTFWRSISRDNVTTFYGKTAASRIADPADPSRIFTWLSCESFDDKGNAAVYEYVAEDARNVDTALASEHNRLDASRSANRYLKRVKYANRTSKLVQPDLVQMTWLFELVMDYGDHEGNFPGINPSRSWPVRPDPFSNYRAGFEIRTYRRCGRFLMFHRFDELGPEPKLVRSLTLDYDDFAYPQVADTQAELHHSGSTKIGSFLRRATITGYAGNGVGKSMPPLELTYSRPLVSEVIQSLDAASAANLPAGVDGERYQWLDLDCEGVSGILTDQGSAWWYKQNLGQGRLGPQQLVALKPAAENEPRVKFLDLAGDGPLDLVQLARPNSGFFERDEEGGWSRFASFASQPNLDWNDPNLRLVDLTGDGHADVLITEADRLAWHPSLAEGGFGPRQAIKTATDEAAGPKLIFHDGTETIFLADMSGDGLSDLVRIRNAEVSYWPNLGHGRFGRKIIMDDAPVLDAPELFEPSRIRLADIDGSGVVDILYLSGDGVRLYFNRCGNSWSAPHRLVSFQPVDNVATVHVTDLLGNGTACLVWSTPLPHDSRAPLQYVDLMGGQKPHLLIGIENNLGTRTVIQYKPSTYFYVDDQLRGRPWITKLPFPVHVVERTEVYDDISRNRFVTRFAYHHGYYDGIEREFRGFGMVEQWDTEEFAALNVDQELSPATNIDASSHVPPVLTRTWFHTGIAIGREHVSNFFAGLVDANDIGEYYREPGLTDEQARRLLLDDTALPAGLTVDEEREACRALKGAMLRQEVYALDGTEKQTHPYSVAEQNFTIRLVQPQRHNRPAVFFSHPRESISYRYERVPDDPRIAQSLTMEVDDFGNVLRSATVAYGRRRPDPALEPRDQSKQTEIHVTYAENSFTNHIEQSDEYRTPLPCEARSYELTGLTLPSGRSRFSLDEVRNAGSAAAVIAYEQSSVSGLVQKRLTGQVRIIYRRDDLTGPLPLGRVDSLAIPFENYKLALTPGLLVGVYGAKVTDSMLIQDGRYVHSEGDNQWWMSSGLTFHSPGASDDAAVELAHARRHFFLSRRYHDPFGHSSIVTYDAYDLLVTETSDALGNRVTAGERDATGNVVLLSHDYRVLQPRLMTDPNGNRAAVSFDAMGMVVGSAVMGKRGETPRRGDSLDGFTPDLSDDVVAAYFADPLADPHAILGKATTRLVYDLFAFQRTKHQAQPAPSLIATLTRETHDVDLAAGEQTKIQHSFSYSDGFGNVIQRKIQAEPGPVPRRDADGTVIVGSDGQPEMTVETVAPRWAGSGWILFNNKGKPVRRFEPFFTDRHGYESDVRLGVSSVLFYDPVSRVVATLHPNHTWEKVVFGPWRQETWDVNDTLLLDPKQDQEVTSFFLRLPDADYLPAWHGRRVGGGLGAEEQDAAHKATVHAGTPSVAHADSLGRTMLTVVHNKYERDGTMVEEQYATRVELDIEGNQRAVIDANDRVVIRYDYDMLGTMIHQAGMEAGERWMLRGVTGQTLYTWDSRDHQFRTSYDELWRATGTFLREGAGAEVLIGRTVYGESGADPEAKNQRGKAVQLFDQAGVVTSDEYDFKGNLLTSRRQLTRDYKTAVDWSGNLELEPEIFIGRTAYDAMNRPLSITAPDNSVYRPVFNEANLLEKAEVNLRGAQAATTFVSDIDYDAKGRRLFIEYGNGVRTTYEYDQSTFRVTRVLTTRLSDHTRMQDLKYTYDPVGNVTQIHDDAQQTMYFSNQVASPNNDYTYDAIYRLITAQGREHIGQASHPQTTWDDQSRIQLPHPGDAQAMRRYRERYEYDAAGNFLQLIHQATNGNWTRTYSYNEPSLLEPDKQSNRLSSTAVGSGNAVTETYQHDSHGNMTAMPHMPRIDWNFLDQLSNADLGGGGTAYYVYDAGGQRVRKIVERNGGALIEERLYLGGFEIFRRRNGTGPVTLERATLHVMEDTQRIALVETRTKGDDGSPAQLIRYQFANHLGSASLELDGSGQIISYEAYYPYGSTSYQAARNQTEMPKRYRYTGMERDEESGFDYHGARYYLPWLGRWVSADPAGIAGGGNLFAYALCNPIMLIDRFGMQPESLVNLPRDAEGNYWLGEEIIEVHGVAPEADPDEKARRAGTTNIVSRDEFERQRNFELAQSVRRGDYGDWTEDSWRTYYNDVYGAEETSRQYYEELGAKYKTYRNNEAAKLHEGWRRIDNAAGVVNAIGWGTIGAIALFGGGAGLITLESTPAVYGASASFYGSGAKVLAGTIAYGIIAPPGAPDLPGPGDDVGRVVRGTGRAASEADDIAAIGKQMDAAGGERVWFAGPAGANESTTVAARFGNNSVSFDTRTTNEAVETVLLKLERDSPGAHVYIGSGTHGTPQGNWAPHDPKLTAPKFYIEDVATTAAGELPGLGPRYVSYVGRADEVKIFSGAEKAAGSAPPGTMFCFAAWCFSTVKKPAP